MNLALLVLLSAVPVSNGAPQFDAHRVTNPETGLVTFASGTLSTPLSGDLSQAALGWALSRRSEWGLPVDSTLRLGNSFGTRFGASFHLQQVADGLDVEGAEIVVTIDQQARVVQVAASPSPYRAKRLIFSLSPEQALRRAAKQVPLPQLKADGTPVGAWRKAGIDVLGELHAAYVVHVDAADYTKNWFAAVDATDGQVLWVQNRVHQAPLDALAYQSSPGGLDAGVGVTPTLAVSLMHADGGSMVRVNDGGFLVGTQIDGYNCCINTDCAAGPEVYADGGTDGGPNRARGTTTLTLPVVGTRMVTYDVAACQRRPMASNDVNAHGSGDYVYQPVDPPDAGAIVQADPANTDPFSEVHAFYQVNKQYDWARGLSATAAPLFPGHQPAIVPFQMRDERMGKKPATWVNVVFPNFNELLSGGLAALACLQTPPCRIDTLTRIPNAAFVPTDQSMQIPLPELRNDVDTLMIFQADRADFAYDAPVLWHEFGHGIVYATAGLQFDGLAIDQRSANNETGALHEGFADYLSGAYGKDPVNGRYVGPRISTGTQAMGVKQESYLRTLDNDFSCPSVLEGEVHQDSQHVAAALWRARQDHFLGSDQGNTFDAAVYAMLVSLPTRADFATVASSMVSHVRTAFGETGATQMQALFDQRGVTNCSKVLEVNAQNLPRPSYTVYARNSTTLAAGSAIPGPYQMKLTAPAGIKSLTVTATVSAPLSSSGFGGATSYQLKLLARVREPVIFAKVGNVLQSTADSNADAPVSGGNMTATANIDVPCGQATDVYFTIGNLGTSTATLSNLNVTTVPGCVTPDAGTPDAGAGSEVTMVPQAPNELGKPQPGCGCSGGAFGPLAGIALLALARRRRR